MTPKGPSGRRARARKAEETDSSHTDPRHLVEARKIEEPRSARRARSTPAVRDCLIVSGMHRSGASAVMRLANLLGAALGESADAEPDGGFENPDVAAANERILKRVDIGWSSVEAFPIDWFGSAGAAEVDRHVAAVLENNFQGRFLFGFKDARICRTLPIWLTRLEASGVRPLCVVVLRNPLDVAASLKQRDGMSLARSLLLWLRHYTDVEAHSRSVGRVFVSYEDLMVDWRGVAQRIAHRLDLVWPVSALRVGEEIDGFLSPQLRHHATPASHLYLREDIPALVKDAYRALLQLQEDPEDEEAKAALDAVLETLELVDDTFNSVAADYETELRSARAGAGGRIAAEQALADALGEIATRLASLRMATGDTLGDETGEAATVEGVVEAVDALAASLNAQKARQEEQAAALLDDVRKSEAALEEARRDKTLADLEAGRARDAVGDLEARLVEARQAAVDLDAARWAVETIVADFSAQLPFEKTRDLLRLNEPVAVSDLVQRLKDDLGVVVTALAERARQKEELAESHRSLAEAEERLAAERASVALLESRLTDSRRENEKGDERYDDLVSLFRAEQQRAAEIENDARKSREESAAKTSALQAAIEGERQQRELAEKLSSELDQARSALDDALDGVARVEGEKRDVEATVVLLRQQLAGLAEANDRLEADRARLQIELEGRRAAEEKLANDVEALQSIRDRLQEDRIAAREQAERDLADERARTIEAELRWQASQEEARLVAQSLEAARAEAEVRWQTSQEEARALEQSLQMERAEADIRWQASQEEARLVAQSLEASRAEAEVRWLASQEEARTLAESLALAREDQRLLAEERQKAAEAEARWLASREAARALEQSLQMARVEADVRWQASQNEARALAESLAAAREDQRLLEEERQKAAEAEARWLASQEEAGALAQSLELARAEEASRRQIADRLEAELDDKRVALLLVEGRVGATEIEKLFAEAEAARLREEIETVRASRVERGADEARRRDSLAHTLTAKRRASSKARHLEKMLRSAEDRKSALERVRRGRDVDAAMRSDSAKQACLERREALLAEARQKLRAACGVAVGKAVPDAAWSTQLRLRLAGTGLMSSRPPNVSVRGLDMMRAGLFDAEHYRRQIDALPTNVDPLLHYLHIGWKTFVDPHPLFSVRFYLDRNPDVAAAGVEPFDHYLTYGCREGRNPHPLFHTNFYLSGRGAIPEERSPIEDFLAPGGGVDPHPLFDHEWYAARAGLGKPSAAEALLHYLSVGWTAGARVSPLFDSAYYLAQLEKPDGVGMEPYCHFALYGAKAGFDPTPLFDSHAYRAARAAADPNVVDPFLDYLQIGESEGMAPNALFDPVFYISQTPETTSERRGALWHYATKGAVANAPPHPLFDVPFVAKKYKSLAQVEETLLGVFLREGMPKFDTPSPLIDVTHYAGQVGVELGGGHPLAHLLGAPAEALGDPHPLFNVGYYLSQIPAGTPSHWHPLIDFIRKVPTKKLLNPSPYFDSAYYVSTYSDVKRAGMNPLKHYILFGAAEGRKPREDLDMAAYRRQTGLDKGVNPLIHFVKAQQGAGAIGSAPIAFIPPGDLAERELAIHPGRRPRREDAKTVLVVAHTVGKYLFGGERSFIDMLDGFAANGINVVAALPGDIAEYTEAVRDISCEVIVFAYPWWRNNPISEDTIEVFEDIIIDKRIDAVHVNTIVLREPLLAAANCGVPGAVHVRELIQHDAALCETIGAGPEEIIEQTLARADWIIANSKATAAAFDKPGRTFVVPNTIDIAAFDIPNIVDPNEIRFGIVSSNVPKKGIDDVVALARACEFVVPNARFVVIGPETQLTNDLLQEQARGAAPSNLVIAGYAESPRAAMEKIDVVINFSHFAESFGRTVLEAMAARRAVVAYEWGAIPELVEPGVTGELVPYLQPILAIGAIQKLCATPGLIVEMGEAGRRIAVDRYSKEHYARLLGDAYATIFDPSRPPPPAPIGGPATTGADAGQKSKTKKSSLPEPADMPLPTGARVLRARAFQKAPDWSAKPRIAYFCWHFPVPSETFVLSELRYLVAQGHDVVVFCRQSPYKDFKPDFPIVWKQVKTPQELADRLIETERTVAHGHFVYPTVTDFLWPACEMANVPFTFIAHAQDIFRYSNDEKNRIGEICRSPLCLRLFVLSRFHRQFVIERGVPPEKIVINPNSVDTARMVAGDNPDRSDRAFRAICAVHRFSEKKGLENLIRAGKELAADGIAIDLYGYGELEGRFKEVIAELGLTNVRICGRVHNYDELCDVLRRYDMFACPSVRTADGDMDGIPTSAIEAMAAGLPVLTTAISGIPDLVTDGITGIVCEPDPDSIVAAVRRYYAMPPGQVEAIITAARAKVAKRHDINRIGRVLLRVWERKTIDIVIVGWTHLEEHKAVIDRLYEHTSLPFHLIVCANSNDEKVVELFERYYIEKDNFTLIHSGYNAFVGPGTNHAMNQGWSDIGIYVCGREGFVFRSGWEIPFVHAMAENPQVGLAGTLCHSPTYLVGRQYPEGVKEFERFRNKSFAAENPDRIFSHVQGGFFAIRRKMYAEIGGFSEDVPHSYTDVEYSYYVESTGWKLGEVEGLMAVFNKSRPPLAARLDETILAAHPPEMKDLETFDAITRGERHNCNVCCWSGDAFIADGGDMVCPSCGSTMADRALFRWLTPTVYLYRRLPAIAIGLSGAIERYWAEQFQGPRLDQSALFEMLRDKGRLPNRDRSLEIGVLRGLPTDHERRGAVFAELARLLKPGAKLVFQTAFDAVVRPHAPPPEFGDLMALGFDLEGTALYFSHSTQLDWAPLFVFTRRAEGAPAPRAERERVMENA